MTPVPPHARCRAALSEFRQVDDFPRFFFLDIVARASDEAILTELQQH